MFTHTGTIQYISPSGALTATLTANGDNNLEQDITVPAATPTTYKATIVEATLQSIELLCKTTAMTVVFHANTDGSGTAVLSVTLAANVPYTWFVGTLANPFTGDAASFIATSTAGGVLSVRALMQT